MNIAIIGAGPAGIMASIQAAKSSHKLFLIDSNERIGRKLLTTGSGRCNITNQNIQSSLYQCEKTEFIDEVLARYSPEKFCSDLESLGIPVYSTQDGWTYPISNSASNVVDILETHLNHLEVNLLTGKKVNHVSYKNGTFQIGFSGKNEPLFVDKLLFATGGKAYPVLGSDGEIFEIIKSLGHPINPVFPALSPLTTEMKFIHKLQGVRQDVNLSLYGDGKKLVSNSGNIIFTNWGINGPGVMDVSHFVGKNKMKKYYLEINFIYPNEEILEKNLNLFRNNPIPLNILLESILSKKIIQTIFYILNIPENILINSLNEDEIKSVVNLLKRFRVDIKGTRGFDFCQASGGGVWVSDVNPQNMQSRIKNNLFFAGEVMDVVGPCGGYNLHWAFASGYIAGKSLQMR